MTDKAQQELQARQTNEVAATNDAGTIMTVISRAASDPETDVTKLERLLDMYERIDRDNARKQFWADFAEMQQNMPVITERGEIKVKGQLQSSYAKFEDIQKAVRPILKDYGFAMSFSLDSSSGMIAVTGRLAHRAGHVEETTFTLPPDTSGNKNQIQSYGSAQSYAQRYATIALLNIETRGMDDDGGSAVGPEPITQQQASEITDLLDSTGSDEQRFLKWVFGGRVPENASVSDIPQTMYQRCVTKLQEKLKQQGGEQ